MSLTVRQLIFAFALDAPFLAITVLFIVYFVRRAVWKRKRQSGKNCSAFCPPSFALGTLMLFTQVFYRPTVSYVLEAKLDEEIEQDDQGDPETGAKQLDRQLKRIRRGEEVGDLELRL